MRGPSDAFDWKRRMGNTIYVLHCFEKDRRKTDKRDIAAARARLQHVLRRLREGHE